VLDFDGRKIEGTCTVAFCDEAFTQKPQMERQRVNGRGVVRRASGMISTSFSCVTQTQTQTIPIYRHEIGNTTGRVQVLVNVLYTLRMNRQTNSHDNLMKWSSVAGVTLMGIALGTFYKTLVCQYGWQGAFRLLWEGEPYSPRIQSLLDSLADAEKAIVKQEARMNAIEEALDRARLDSVDDAKVSKAIVKRWVENYHPKNLEKSIAELSSTLDKLAAQVDAVILSSSDIKQNCRLIQDDIKQRKKTLSKQLVAAMERCDEYMACFQVLHG
jgi:hypothetical protein